MRQTPTAKHYAGQMAFHGGAAAEAVVERRYAGCEPVARRWRGSGGEIDLILREGDAFIFVEVKKSRSFEQAACRITPKQTRRIFETAMEFVALQPAGLLRDMRFDVALVDGVGDVSVIENALHSDGIAT